MIKRQRQGLYELITAMNASGRTDGEASLSDMIDAVSSASGRDSPPGAAPRPGHAGDPEKSIFSQLFERLLQGCPLKLERAADEAETSLEILLDGVPDAVIIVSLEGAILEANQAFFASFGYDRPDLVGASIFRLLPEEYREAFRGKLAEFGAGGATPHKAKPSDVLVFRGQRGDGSIVSMDCLLSSIQLPEQTAVIALIRDLSFDRTLFEQLRETRDHYVALTETITEAILRIDDGFSVIFANSGVKNTFGWEREEVVGKPFSALFPPEVFATHEQVFRKYFYVDDQDRLAVGLKRTFEFLGATKHRGVAPMEMSFGNSKDQKGRTLTCVIRDISQRKTLERKLRHLAYHDKLTGLGNRELFNEDLDAILRNFPGDGFRRSAVLFLDLDGFKHVNDTLGHDAGDELLIETARRIRFSLREQDAAYRFGGDEFVVVLSEIKEASDAAVVSERILSNVSNHYVLKSADARTGAGVSVGVSIGVAVVPDHGTSIEDVTKCADIAMYCSKEGGKNRFTLYDPAATTKSTERWRLEQEMRLALGNGGFHTVYQPIVDGSGRVVGLEALLRWSRPEDDPVPPSVFIPIAEEHGLIIPLGDRALRRACCDARRIHEKGYADVYMAVNLSGKQFEQSDFVGQIEGIVRSSGIDPARLKLELTESTLMENTEDGIEKMLEIKRRLPGVSFMIDDFGTGYSSLAYLSRLPADALKIDLSFVVNLREAQNEKVVNAIIQLGHSLDLDIVAEGIETDDQWRYFIDRGCESMQGYHFLKPAPLDKAYAFIVDNRRRS